jgi:outer membrane protein assembly factor BamB
MKWGVRTILALASLVTLCWVLRSADTDSELADAEKTLKDASIATDDASLVKFFDERIVSDETRARLQKAIRELGDDEFAVRERAEDVLLKAGGAALPFLKAAEADPDPEISGRVRRCLEQLDQGVELRRCLAVLKVMAKKKPAGAAKSLLNYLPYAEDEYLQDAMMGALVSLTVTEGKADDSIRGAAESKSTRVRNAAAYVLARAGAEDRRLAIKLLDDKDSIVAFQAASGLVRAGVKEAVPSLMRLLTDGTSLVAFQSEDLLYRLGGEKPPNVSLGKADEASRKKTRDAWETWWKTNVDSVDLAKLNLEKALKGITLICEHDGSGRDGMGRIWECGRDGKVIWELDNNLGGPIDACILANGHVLIAEYKANRVTERDREGKVLWTHQTTSSAISCQRLANGNTLIGTLTEIVEVTRDNKVVVQIPARNGSIWSAYKGRNGNIVYAESSGNVVEVDPATGKQLQSVQVGGMEAWGGVEQLANGHLLVSKYGASQIVEIDWKGNIESQATTQMPSFSTRLPNGHTLATNTNNNAVVELDRQGKEIWKQQTTGRPFRTWRY